MFTSIHNHVPGTDAIRNTSSVNNPPSSPSFRAGSPAKFDQFHPEQASTSGTKEDILASTSSSKGRLSSAAGKVSQWFSSGGSKLADVAKRASASTLESIADMADPDRVDRRYTETTSGIAKKHGCQHMPFSQSLYLKEHLPKHYSPLLKELNVSPENMPYACLGLSMTWAQARAHGAQSKQYFKRLGDSQDSVMNAALMIQHKEQKKYPGRTQDAFQMLKGTLPKLELAPRTDAQKNGSTLYQVPLEAVGKTGGNLLRSNGEQTFILLSPYHAMAMHKEANGQVEFYDPDYGLVKAEKKENMMDFLKEVHQRDEDKLLGPKLFGMRANSKIQVLEIVPQKRNSS